MKIDTRFDALVLRYQQLVAAVFVNCFPSRIYGRMEFTLSLVKVALIILVGA